MHKRRNWYVVLKKPLSFLLGYPQGVQILKPLSWREQLHVSYC